MFRSIKGKLIIPVIGILTLLFFFISMYAQLSRDVLTDSLVEERFITASRAVRAYLERVEESGRMAARITAGSQSLISYVRGWNEQRDRSQTRQELISYLNERLGEFSAVAFVITDSEGYVILRTHELGRYGDSGFVSSTIAAAHSGEVTSAYIVSETFMMGLSSTAPILDDGEIIGTVSTVK